MEPMMKPDTPIPEYPLFLLQGFEVNRSYQTRISFNHKRYPNGTPETMHALQDALRYTHETYNRLVRQVIERIFAVMADETNPDFACLTRWAVTHMKAGECATHFARPFITTSEAGPTHSAYKSGEEGKEMAELFHRCKARGDRWYNRDDEAFFGPYLKERGGSGFVDEVNQGAIEKVKAFVALKNRWQEGDQKVLHDLSPDDFVKRVLALMKQSEETLRNHPDYAEPLADLLDTPSAKRKTYLQNLHRESGKTSSELFNRGIILDVLNHAYFDLTDQAMGKKGWLVQRRRFLEDNPEFVTETLTRDAKGKMVKVYGGTYCTVLEAYNQRRLQDNEKAKKDETEARAKGKNPRRVADYYPAEQLPKRWDRDGAFLKVLDTLGNTLSGGLTYTPIEPLLKTENLDEERQAKAYHKRFAELMRQYNGHLLKSNGFLGLLDRYRQFEGTWHQEFGRPPALRLPDPVHHPEWMNLSAKGCFQYSHLTVGEPGVWHLKVKLLDRATDTFKIHALILYVDKRLREMKTPAPYMVKQGYYKQHPETRILEWHDKVDKKTGGVIPPKVEFFGVCRNPNPQEPDRYMEIGGANLITKNGGWYLNFLVTYRVPRIAKKDTIQPGDRLMAVDLGQKTDAVLAMGERLAEPCPETGLSVRLIAFRPFMFDKTTIGDNPPKSVRFQFLHLPGGLSFRAVTHAEKKRNHQKKHFADRMHKHFPSPQGKTQGRFMNRGEEFGKALKRYINNCRQTRLKTLAGAFVRVAMVNDCKFIRVENLESYKTNIKIERSENRRLGLWSAQKLYAKDGLLDQLCRSSSVQGQGINYATTGAAYTSQLCHRCGHWGVRANEWDQTRLIKELFELTWVQSKLLTRKECNEWLKNHVGDIRIYRGAPGGDWFFCSNSSCSGLPLEKRGGPHRYRVQADANAAANLVQRAMVYDEWAARCQSKDKKTREKALESITRWLGARYPKCDPDAQAKKELKGFIQPRETKIKKNLPPQKAESSTVAAHR
jgi:hypothetical protein